MNIKPIYINDPNLIVGPISTEDTYDDIKIDKNLPQHPCLLYVPGPTSAGKSTLVQWLLAKPYNKFFDKIYIISSTIHKDRSWKKFKFDEERTYERYSDESFKEIVDDIESTEDGKCLIIIDDMTAQNIFNGNNELCKFISVHRHSPPKCPPNICGTSIWIISHQYKAIQKKIRGLMTDLIVFRLRSDEEIQAISEDCKGLHLTHDQFKKDIYLPATKEKYNFLYIQKKSEKPFRINFNIILDIEE